MVPIPVMTQPTTFDRPYPDEMEHFIRAAAMAAVAASKSSTANALLPPSPCGLTSIQLPIPNEFPSQPRPILSKPLGMMDLPSMQKLGGNTATIASALLNTKPVAMIRMDSYMPLLEIAIRHAVNDCISGLKGDVSLHGNLTICSESGEKVSVFFNDQQKSIPQPSSPVSSQTQNQTPSKRKAYLPIRHFPVDSSPTSSSSSPPLNIPASEYVSTQLSGSLSPSTTDSGALDLSRAGSLNGSAPITPMKVLSMQESLCRQTLPVLQQTNFLEMYQNLMNFSIPDFHQSYHHQQHQQQEQLRSSTKASRKRICLPREHGVPRRPTASRKFPCNQCGDEFASLHSLEDHTITVHGTYRCHVCKSQFTQRSNLQRHALKHVGFKPFECRLCSKSYYRKDHLMRHMEMGHPMYTAREHITVRLTSSESLDYLSKYHAKESEFQIMQSVKEEGEEMKQDDEVALSDVTTSSIDKDTTPLEIVCTERTPTCSPLVGGSKPEDISDETMQEEMAGSEELQSCEEPCIKV